MSGVILADGASSATSIGARKLLEHCSGSDTLMGAAPVWASVLILLVLGFVPGFACGALAVRHTLNRRLQCLRARYQASAQEAEMNPPAGLPAVLRFKRSTSPRAGETTGPLSVGMASAPLQGDVLPNITAVDNPAFRASVGESPVQSIPVQGLDQGSQLEAEIPIEAILGQQSSLAKEGSTIKAYTSVIGMEDAQEDMAITQPFTVPDTNTAARLARRTREAESVGDAYDMDDLDDEWKELLCQIDARLLTLGAQTMDSQERAVAIRSLLVSTARETPEQALAKAILDIERYRRIHRH